MKGFCIKQMFAGAAVLVLALVFSIPAAAQGGKVTATLQDAANGEGIGFATVSLTKTGTNKAQKYGDGKISVNGWKEDSVITLSDFIRDYMKKGITQVLCTDINRDGMLQGPAVQLYRSLLKEFPGIKLIASGGVSSVQDLMDLKEAGLPAAIVGKAYYEGHITLDQLSKLSQE